MLKRRKTQEADNYADWDNRAMKYIKKLKTIETGKVSMDDLDITPDRRREIDEILMETHKKYINGEIKARPLKEFLEERKIQERKSGCDEGDE